jgi:hypothetical protein
MSNRAAIHEKAVDTVEAHFVARCGLRPNPLAQTADLHRNQYQRYSRRRIIGDAMPCDLVVKKGKRLVFVKAASARTSFTSFTRFAAYVVEAGHDYLIVADNAKAVKKLEIQFPRLTYLGTTGDHIARIVTLEDLPTTLALIK